ncbi:MAG: NUDIX domain-containing protein [Candidatus Saccharimonadales bacterium]|jgi:8-oxo-dGTP pyrophosphatase MutT (NUDIX family)
MPHIHTEPGQHDITASAFIILLSGDEPKLLLHEHRKLGRLLQYGGHVELTETPWDAALHEVREESGYDPDQLQVLQPLQHMVRAGKAKTDPLPACISTHPYGGDESHFHTDLAYAVTTSESPRHEVAAGESNEHLMVTQSELAALDDTRIFPSVQQVGLFVFTLLDSWRPVHLSEYRKK